jgi:hypothetical protein
MFILYDKVKLLTRIVALSTTLFAMGCNQDAIFYYISGETAPTKPLIRGSPSKIVSVDANGTDEGGENLYLANGRIWGYDLSTSIWSRSPGPGGYVVDVASVSDGAKDVLYALADRAVSKYDGSGWTKVSHSTESAEYGFVQNIFGAKDILFATGAKSVGDEYEYAILYCKPQDSEFTVLSLALGNSCLSGAGKVGGDYYLATMGTGVYKASGASLTAEPAKSIGDKDIPSSIAGFFQTTEPEAIIGISRNGIVLYINAAAGLRVDDTSLGGTYTGALALTDLPEPHDDGFDKLLLLGYQGSKSSYEHGYMELKFKSSDGTYEKTRVPGAAQPSSVSDYRQYDSSIRRYPVTALWVLEPVGEAPYPVIFAATNNQGLYSYRARSDGGWQWNHEE